MAKRQWIVYVSEPDAEADRVVAHVAREDDAREMAREMNRAALAEHPRERKSKVPLYYAIRRSEVGECRAGRKEAEFDSVLWVGLAAAVALWCALLSAAFSM